MLIDATVLGLGVALARASLVADRLSSGALVCPLRLAAPTALSYYLLCLPEAVPQTEGRFIPSFADRRSCQDGDSILSIDQWFVTTAQDEYVLETAA